MNTPVAKVNEAGAFIWKKQVSESVYHTIYAEFYPSIHHQNQVNNCRAKSINITVRIKDISSYFHLTM